MLTNLYSCGKFSKKRNDISEITNKETIVDTSKISPEELYLIEKQKYDLIKTKSCKSIQCEYDFIECNNGIFKLSARMYDDFYYKVIDCAFSLAKKNELRAELLLVKHYDNIYESHKEYYKERSKFLERPIGQLRSPEAFEVAMKYARHGQWDDCCDDVGPSHSGINFIYKVIDSMVKEIYGKTVWNYFHPDKMFEMGYETHFDKKSSDKTHQYMWNELDKAWKSGNIVLKKYGE